MVDSDSSSKNNLSNSRFTLVIPLDLAIKIDIAREKTRLSKVAWITDAITEKIKAEETITKEEKNNLEEIKNELKDIKNLLLKT